MSNLMTAGVSFALLSADSYAKMASKPMQMASTELKMREPDMDFVNRTMSYGTNELDKSEKAKKLAEAELAHAQEVAKAEKKAEDEARLEKAREENKLANEQLNELVSNNSVDTTIKVPSGDVVVTDDSVQTTEQPVKTDSVEISKEVTVQLSNTDKPIIATDVPKTYSADTKIIAVDVSKSKPKLDARA